MAANTGKKVAAVAGGLGLLGLLAWLFGRESDGDGDRFEGEEKLDETFKGERVEDETFRGERAPVPFVASSTVCHRTGQPYNAAQLGTPRKYLNALRKLGVGITMAQLRAADAAAPASPLWAVRPGTVPLPNAELEKFQALARSKELAGHVGAPASSVDGIPGECTAISISDALALQVLGEWPP